MGGEKQKPIESFNPPEETHDVEPMMMEEGMDLIVQRAEKQLAVLDKVLGIAVKRTTHYDWVDQMGKPYLTSSGAEKLMPLFGVCLTNTRCEKNFANDDKGQYYLYQYKGTFSWKGGSIEAIGACSSRDKFFAWDSREQTYKPLSEVDETNILKAAYSNMMVNGITRLLGIRNLTWENLQKYGIDKGKSARVEYGHRTNDISPEEKKMQEEISKWCMKMANNDKAKAISFLVELTKFTGKDKKEVAGVTSTKMLKGKRLQISHHKVKEEYERVAAIQDLDTNKPDTDQSPDQGEEQ